LSDSLFNLDEIEPLPIFAPIAAHIRGLRARVAELEAQNRHDDEADTECRNLIMSENDDLRARVAELEEECEGKGRLITAQMALGVSHRDRIIDLERALAQILRLDCACDCIDMAQTIARTTLNPK
jgi:hypothetical protein